MEGLELRPARPADAPGLAPLLAALGYPATADAITGRLAALAASDSGGLTLVAEAGGRLLGFATLHVTPVLHRPTAVGRITALAVHPEAREAGIGRRLVEAAEERFLAAGLGLIELTSGESRREAHEFYRHLGYAPHGVRLTKVLVPPRPGGG